MDKQSWEIEIREELDLRYTTLGISKQPIGNREEWIEADIELIRAQRNQAKKEVLEMAIERVKETHAACLKWVGIRRHERAAEYAGEDMKSKQKEVEKQAKTERDRFWEKLMENVCTVGGNFPARCYECGEKHASGISWEEAYRINALFGKCFKCVSKGFNS